MGWFKNLNINLGITTWGSFFGVISFFIIVIGYSYYLFEKKESRETQHQELSLIGTLKSNQIQQWRTDRLSDVARLANDPLLIHEVENFFLNQNITSLSERLYDRLLIEQNAHGFTDAQIVDPAGNLLFSVQNDHKDPLYEATKQTISDAAKNRTAVMSDVYRCSNNVIHIDAVAPIIDGNDQVIAIAILRSDANDFLYPLIQTWPTPSESAETLIVEREGDDVLFLNELRHQSDTALTLRDSLDNKSLPAVQAVLGRQGLVEGKDYRGVDVLADIRAIPNTSWFLISKVDKHEMLEELKFRFAISFILVILLIVLTAFILIIIHKHQEEIAMRGLYEVKNESEKKFRTLFENMAAAACIDELIFENGVAVDYRILDVNPAFENIVGLNKSDVVGKLGSAVYGVGKAPFLDIVSQVVETGIPAFFETYFPFSQKHLQFTSARMAENKFSNVFIDVTQQKLAEESLKRIEWMLIKRHSLNKNEQTHAFEQFYGDLTKLNENGLILQSVGHDTLKTIVDDYLHLLGTSAAVYEKNGDYALGIFASNWCKLMDSSSRELCNVCNPVDNKTALESGKWLCHESCWTDCSKKAIEKQTPVDIECNGGIHLYSVPILANDKVIGAINFGYGDPPVDSELLNKLAETYKVDSEKLQQTAENYDSRPQFIIDMAKERLKSSARLIGLLVENKLAEEELKEKELRYRQLYEQASVGIFTTTSTGQVISINPAMATILGLPETENASAIYNNLAHQLYVNPEQRDEFIHILREDGFVNNFEYEARTIDGRPLWLNMNARVKKWRDDGTFIIEGFTNDITETKHLEQQLHQSQKLEMVGRLAGGVAHDFNNMLSVIMGYSDIVLTTLDPSDPNYASMTAINDAAIRSADLTRQLLAFARKQTIAPKVLDLNQTITNMLKMLERLIGEDINLLWKPGESLWTVFIDPAQIDQLLTNLMVNARDAIVGTGKITIETANIEIGDTDEAAKANFIPGQYVLITVSDDGCGMDKEIQDQIFEPFYTTKEKGQGTGLGLSTVYGIVKQNQGFINVYSEPGHGTSFKIYLTRHQTDDTISHDQHSTETIPLGTETILLVEDEKNLLLLCEKLLNDLGYNVISANTPEMGIEISKSYSNEIHLLLTDVIMPGISGKDLWNKIHEIRPNIKCLYMSGYTANVIAHHGVLDEGVYFLQKPFTRESLSKKIREVLS